MWGCVWGMCVACGGCACVGCVWCLFVCKCRGAGEEACVWGVARGVVLGCVCVWEVCGRCVGVCVLGDQQMRG